MTTKQASITFKLDEKEIRKRNKEGMIIGSTKEKGLIIIPDETKILPSKVQIQSFLFQILKYKNNPAIVISRHMCPTIEHLKILAEYLYSKGYIGEYKPFVTINSFFDNVQVTEEGIRCIFDNNTAKIITPMALSFAPSVKVGIVNL